MKDLINRLRDWNGTSHERNRVDMAEAADAIEKLEAENERLTGCLRRANSNHEEFERKWYLATDENAQLKAELAAMRAAPIFGFHWRRGWEWGFSLTGDFNASDKSSFTALYAAPGAKP